MPLRTCSEAEWLLARAQVRATKKDISDPHDTTHAGARRLHHPPGVGRGRRQPGGDAARGGFWRARSLPRPRLSREMGAPLLEPWQAALHRVGRRHRDEIQRRQRRVGLALDGAWRSPGLSSAKLPRIAKRSGYFRTASMASALESGSHPWGGWINAASTPASSISRSTSSAVNCATLRCSPDVGVTVCDQIWTCASMIFMGDR